MDLKRVAVVGAGTMGSGIAQWFTQAGCEVQMTDVNLKFAEDQLQNVKASWDKLLSKGKFTADQISLFKGKISVVALNELNPETDLVVEAIVEKKNIKIELFQNLSSIVKKNCIFASNTSSIPIEEMAEGLSEERKANFLGLHFFNPAPIMKLVEIISGKDTANDHAAKLYKWFEEKGKKPAACKDSPGFIVNRVARNFYGEALRLAGSHDQNRIREIDTILKEVGMFRMGPFELMDLIGIDVNYSVTCSVWESFDKNARFAPHPLQKQMVDEGRLGKKSGRGFYD